MLDFILYKCYYIKAVDCGRRFDSKASTVVEGKREDSQLHSKRIVFH